MNRQHFSLLTLWRNSLLRARIQKVFSWECFAACNRLYLETTSASANTTGDRSGLAAIWGHIGMIHKLSISRLYCMSPCAIAKCSLERLIISIVLNENNQAQSGDIITRSNTTGQLLQQTSRVQHLYNCIALFWLFWEETEPYYWTIFDHLTFQHYNGFL